MFGAVFEKLVVQVIVCVFVANVVV